mgnify:CR=1 FL=1
MIRLSQLPKHVRLDLIEEARLQKDREYVDYCIKIDAYIAEFCHWAHTRQGYDYWSWIDQGLFVQLN